MLSRVCGCLMILVFGLTLPGQAQWQFTIVDAPNSDGSGLSVINDSGDMAGLAWPSSDPAVARGFTLLSDDPSHFQLLPPHILLVGVNNARDVVGYRSENGEPGGSVGRRGTGGPIFRIDHPDAPDGLSTVMEGLNETE